MTIRAWFVACASVVVLFGAGAPAGAQVEELTPVTDATLQDPDPADWLSWRRTLDGWGYSPLDEIDRANVGELRLAWSWGMEPGVSQTTPLVHDGILYLANPGNVVQALDAGSGDFIWEYRREMEEARRPAAQMRSLAIYEDLIILNTVDAHVVGLDARTGAVRWETPVMPEGEGYGFSSGPIIAGGVIVAGLRGCERFREDTCYIVGVDARTGQTLWRTSTIARPASAAATAGATCRCCSAPAATRGFPAATTPRRGSSSTGRPRPSRGRATPAAPTATPSTATRRSPSTPRRGRWSGTSSTSPATATTWTRRSSGS